MVTTPERDNQPGETDVSGELSLRASVATLVKVLFHHPDDGGKILALERIATLGKNSLGAGTLGKNTLGAGTLGKSTLGAGTMRKNAEKNEVTVVAKPFGGGVRLINPQTLKQLIGNFNYDSERSRQENDFRILIKPEAWEKIIATCLEHLMDPSIGIIETGPEREIAEEFGDALNIRMTRNNYQIEPRGMAVENLPVKTDNLRAPGQRTVRIYYLYEAWIENPSIISMMLANSTQYTDEDLQNRALNDVQQGGRGRANAILTVRLDELSNIFQLEQPNGLNQPIIFKDHRFGGNVLAILEEVDQTRYKRYNI
jgi:hypothetical protein